MLCTILLLCGDIHLNPGPGNSRLPQDKQDLTPLGFGNGQHGYTTPGGLGPAAEAMIHLSNGERLDYAKAQGNTEIDALKRDNTK